MMSSSERAGLSSNDEFFRPRSRQEELLKQALNHKAGVQWGKEDIKRIYLLPMIIWWTSLRVMTIMRSLQRSTCELYQDQLLSSGLCSLAFSTLRLSFRPAALAYCQRLLSALL
jgi:hypothetical protein